MTYVDETSALLNVDYELPEGLYASVARAWCGTIHTRIWFPFNSVRRLPFFNLPNQVSSPSDIQLNVCNKLDLVTELPCNRIISGLSQLNIRCFANPSSSFSSRGASWRIRPSHFLPNTVLCRRLGYNLSLRSLSCPSSFWCPPQCCKTVVLTLSFQY